MTRLFPKLYLDISSFWAGIILVVLLVVLFLVYRKRLSAFFSRTITNLITFRESLSITSDSDYIQTLYKYSQSLHLFADYFPLESLYVPSECIAPPPYLFPGKESLDTSLVQQVIGYDPLLPQLNSEFFGPTFPLLDAVQTNSNLCFVGYPGTGKTTAIANCIAELVQPTTDEDLPEPRIPFYVKAHHLLAQFPGQDLLGMLLKALQSNRTFLTIPNFTKYLTNAVQSGRSLLFIDDMDGLVLDDINRLANFITSLRAQIPDLQVIATASPSSLGNLRQAPLQFLSIAPWGNQEKYSFLEKLSKLWPSTLDGEGLGIAQDFTVMNSMLVSSGQAQTTLEFVLNSFAAYTGDLLGPSSSHALEAYLNRLPSISSDILNALELIAVYCLDSDTSTFTRRGLSSWFEKEYKKGNTNPAGISSASFQPAIQTGLDHNLIQSDPDNHYYFSSPTIAGYLAAKGVAKSPQKILLGILESSNWGQLHECMRYFSVFNDIKPYLKAFLGDQSLLKIKLLRASMWLEHLKHKSPEETALLKQITRGIHANPYYLVKLRLVCALSRSSNPQINDIFRHLLKSSDLNTRRAAAIGAGMQQDLTAVPFLINQLNDEHPSSTTACYVLGKIGSPRSLEAIAEALLHGSELLRRAAAESLAQNRSEGHPALREGATRDDLLVRYAVVHGLSSINEPWALEILDTMRIDEKEWVVRDLAQQTYEILETRSPYLPQDTPPPHETPWLIEFAAKQELSSLTAENALDLLLKALEIGTDEEIQNALAQLSRFGRDDLVPPLLKVVDSEPFEIAHQAMLAIWFCASQRYKIFS